MAFKRSHKKCEKPSETLLTFKGQWFEGTTDIENRATQPRRLSFVCITPNKFSFIQCKIPSTDDLNSSKFVDEILSLFGFQINATEQIELSCRAVNFRLFWNKNDSQQR